MLPPHLHAHRRPARAQALHLLGQIRGHEDSFIDAISHLEEALTQADEATVRRIVREDHCRHCGQHQPRDCETTSISIPR
jgi:predicted Zn-ribbon and HTH transcriptional regulator